MFKRHEPANADQDLETCKKKKKKLAHVHNKNVFDKDTSLLK